MLDGLGSRPELYKMPDMNSPAALTARQREILAFIERTLAEHGRPPTRAEICTEFAFRSPNAAETHLRALAAKGVISLEDGRARGIRLSAPAGLPLVGQVAAGQPLLAIAHIEDHYPLPSDLFARHADYLLRVRGQSMRDAGILDGDLLAVQRCAEARNGEIVVARVGDEVTVKYFERHATQIRLLPANPDFQPILVDAASAEFNLEGRAVGLLRRDLLAPGNLP